MGQPTADTPRASVAVGTTSTVISSGDTPGRQEITVTNDSDTVIYLWLGSSGATAGQGIRLNPQGGSWTTEEYTGAVSGIHNKDEFGNATTGATKNVCWAEV